MGCFISKAAGGSGFAYRADDRLGETSRQSHGSTSAERAFEGLPQRAGSSQGVRPYRAAIGAALKHPGRTVCIDLQCPRPEDALTADQRSTSDGRIAITYVEDTRNPRLEVASSVYGMPSLKTYAAGDSTRGLRSTAENSLASSLSGLNAGRPRPPSRDLSGRLPGPPHETWLAPRQIELIGVGRWPDPRFNNESSDANRNYGRRFHATVRDAASRIASGHISSWRQLWQFAAGARHEWATLGGDQGEASAASRFAGGYPRDRDEHSTPMNGRYKFLAERVWQWHNNLPVEHNNLLTIIPDADRLPPDFMSHRVLVAQADLDGEPVNLTRLMVPNGSIDDFNSSIASDLQDRKFSRAYPYMMEHAHPDLIQPIMNHVERQFSELLEQQPGLEETLATLGGIHWWMAHSMPDLRGSAAKTEICVRATAGAMGIELPPFRHGVIPDLEAFTADHADFSAGYATLFEHPDYQG